MILSKNKIKFYSSLKIKKFRLIHGQYLVEGEKIIKGLLRNNSISVSQIIATNEWFKKNQITELPNIEIYEADFTDLSRISTMETAPSVIAVLNIPDISYDLNYISGSISVALDDVQDPGNLGTIIRTADWFGIRNIFCSHGCADMYNPKVIQASMGAIVNVKVHYVDLKYILEQLTQVSDFSIMGTFMQGNSLFTERLPYFGMIVFGNESRGISSEYLPFIKQKITIPSHRAAPGHVESLNVASSVAIILAEWTRL